jgi:predicted permease
LTTVVGDEGIAGDPAVVGKTIRVIGRDMTIIGVTPESYGGLILDYASDATTPIGVRSGTIAPDHRNLRYEVLGRLKNGVSLEEARAHLQSIWPAVQEATVPEGYQGEQRARFFTSRITIQSAATGISYLRDRESRPLVVLMAVVAVVLLIASVNLANLMLTRAVARRREVGIRIVVGANIWRLTRQLLTESVMLSLAGGGLGLLFAFWTSRLLLDLMSTGLVSYSLDPTPDLRVLAFTFALTLVAGALFGLAPMWGITQIVRDDALQQNLRTLRSGNSTFARGLIRFQIALSLVLLFAAALFIRSLENMRSVDPGFRREGVLSMLLFPQAGREKIPNRSVYYQRLAEKIAGVSGVESVIYSNQGPVARFGFPARYLCRVHRQLKRPPLRKLSVLDSST